MTLRQQPITTGKIATPQRDGRTPLGIRRRERVLGHIRMGDRGGTNNAPRKLETFRLTSPDEEIIQAISRVYGGDVSRWNDEFQVTIGQKKLHVLIPPVDAYSLSWTLWTGPGKQERLCDGETMGIKDFKRTFRDRPPCICPEDEFEKACKPHIRARFILDNLGIQRDGLWVLDSHGFNAVGELPVTMDKLMGISALILKNPDAIEGVAPQAGGWLSIENRISKAGGQTRRFTVPVLDPDVSQEAVAHLPGYAASMQAAIAGRSLPAAPATFADPPALPGETVDFKWPDTSADTEPVTVEAEARFVEEPEDAPEFNEGVISPAPPEPLPDANKGAMQHYIIVCNEAGIDDATQKEWLERVTDGEVTSRKDATKEQFTAALDYGLGELKAEVGDIGKVLFGVSDEEKQQAADQLAKWAGKTLKDFTLTDWAESARKMREAKPKTTVTDDGFEEQELPW